MAVTTKKLKEDIVKLASSLEKVKGKDQGRVKKPIKIGGITIEPGLDLGRDKGALGELISDLSDIEGVLNVPASVSKTLGSIDKSSEDLQTLLESISMVEQVKKVAQAMSKSVGNFRKKIDPALEKAAGFEKKAASNRKKITAFRKSLEDFYEASGSFQKGLGGFGKIQEAAEACVAAAPSSPEKKELEARLDKLTAITGISLADINLALNGLLKSIKSLVNYIKKDIEPLLVPIKKLDEQVHVFEENLEKLIRPLEEVDEILKRKFSHSFKYAAPVWNNPLQTKTKEVRIGVKTLLDDASKIEKEIEKALSKTLWDVLKLIGLDKFVQELVKKAENAVNRALKKAELETKFNISGFDKMGANLDKLAEKMPDLPGKFDDLDLKSLTAFIAGFDSVPEQWSSLNADCKKASKPKRQPRKAAAKKETPKNTPAKKVATRKASAAKAKPEKETTRKPAARKAATRRGKATPPPVTKKSDSPKEETPKVEAKKPAAKKATTRKPAAKKTASKAKPRRKKE